MCGWAVPFRANSTDSSEAAPHCLWGVAPLDKKASGRAEPFRTSDGTAVERHILNPLSRPTTYMEKSQLPA
jgi:hypothetical protein